MPIGPVITTAREVHVPTVTSSQKQPVPGAIKRLLAGLGPGVITGAADDDPSGIATYSIAGDLNNPKIDVNGWSALAPGFLRNMFDDNSADDLTAKPRKTEKSN